MWAALLSTADFGSSRFVTAHANLPRIGQVNYEIRGSGFEAVERSVRGAARGRSRAEPPPRARRARCGRCTRRPGSLRRVPAAGRRSAAARRPSRPLKRSICCSMSARVRRVPWTASGSYDCRLSLIAARLVTAPPIPISAPGAARPASRSNPAAAATHTASTTSARHRAIEAEVLGQPHRAHVDTELLVDATAAAERELRAAAAGVEHHERLLTEVEPRGRGTHRQPCLLRAGDHLDVDPARLVHGRDQHRGVLGDPQARGADRHEVLHVQCARLGDERRHRLRRPRDRLGAELPGGVAALHRAASRRHGRPARATRRPRNARRRAV